MRLRVAIQTHPRRALMAQALADQIPGAELAIDPEPDGYPSPWRTYRHALETIPRGNDTHLLILQDDVLLCDHFVPAVHAAIAARPDRLLSFFVAGQPFDHVEAVWKASALGEHWAVLPNERWCPAIALAWPRRHIAPCLAYVDTKKWPVTFRADDEIIGRYLREGALECALASVPSLVEHPDLVPSIVAARRASGGINPNRIATCFIQDGCNAAEIDWRHGPE